MSTVIPKGLFYTFLVCLSVFIIAYQIRNMDLLIFSILSMVGLISVGLGWWYRQDYLQSLEQEDW